MNCTGLTKSQFIAMNFPVKLHKEGQTFDSDPCLKLSLVIWYLMLVFDWAYLAIGSSALTFEGLLIFRIIGNSSLQIVYMKNKIILFSKKTKSEKLIQSIYFKILISI